MGDGWETRRRRGNEPAFDWCIVRLGCRGSVDAVEVDTSFFRGNSPDRCSLESADVAAGTDPTGSDVAWHELVEQQPLLVPVWLELSRSAADALAQHAAWLERAGFEPATQRFVIEYSPNPVGQGPRIVGPRQPRILAVDQDFAQRRKVTGDDRFAAPCLKVYHRNVR
ncbi:MAG: hypothetical protein IH811_10525 [Proteobacteria bacterium]|nr:hypothetical protein [Pseudomonadota bacterium]